jgi:hypothetical protein
MGLEGMGCVGMELINFAENRDQWRVVMKIVMNVQTP